MKYCFVQRYVNKENRFKIIQNLDSITFDGIDGLVK